MQTLFSGIVAIVCTAVGVHALSIKKLGWATLLLILAILNGVFAVIGASLQSN